MRFLKSFVYAFRGILYCIRRERNMRFHTAAAVYVLLFSGFFSLSPAEYAVLFLTFALVMGMECVNTSIERLCDRVSPSHSPLIAFSKDAAAGAVLVSALFAVCVGICLFWRPDVFPRIWAWFLERPWASGAFLLSLPCAWWYIFRAFRRFSDS